MELDNKITLRPWYIPVLGILGFLLIGIIAFYLLPNPIDWTICDRLAALELLSGNTPYSIQPFFNPPWVLIPLIPFAVLPYRLGVAALFTTNLAIFSYLGWRMGARPVGLIAFLCSFPVVFCLLFGQIDGLVLLGLFMPRQLGLLFILSKPQVGAAVAFFWLIEAWRSGGWRQVLCTFTPVTVAFLGSFGLYGLWPLARNPMILIGLEHNTSVWPLSLAIGLPLLVYALRNRREGFALISAPFFSPYVSPHSWSIALLGLIPFEAEFVVASLASWILAITRLIT